LQNGAMIPDWGWAPCERRFARLRWRDRVQDGLQRVLTERLE